MAKASAKSGPLQSLPVHLDGSLPLALLAQPVSLFLQTASPLLEIRRHAVKQRVVETGTENGAVGTGTQPRGGLLKLAVHPGQGDASQVTAVRSRTVDGMLARQIRK